MTVEEALTNEATPGQGFAAPSWSPGEAVVVRDVKQGGPRLGCVTHASAAIVVEDSPTRLVLFEPLGADMRTSRVDWATGAFDGPHPQKRHSTDRLTMGDPVRLTRSR